MKIITLALGTTLLIASTAARAVPCADGAGTYGNGWDNREYCKSNVAMNWWSAFAWCEAIGGTLADATDDCACSGSSCPAVSGSTGESYCINFQMGYSAITQSAPRMWTRNEVAGSSGEAYYIECNTAGTRLYPYRKTYDYFYALCRM